MPALHASLLTLCSAGLQVLKASYNRITQLTPLTTCSSLRVASQFCTPSPNCFSALRIAAVHATFHTIAAMIMQQLKPSFQSSLTLQALATTCAANAIHHMILQEIWLQNNQIAEPGQLQALSNLPLLATLFLSQNPLGVSLKQTYRPAVIAASASLQARQPKRWLLLMPTRQKRAVLMQAVTHPHLQAALPAVYWQSFVSMHQSVGCCQPTKPICVVSDTTFMKAENWSRLCLQRFGMT